MRRWIAPSRSCLRIAVPIAVSADRRRFAWPHDSASNAAPFSAPTFSTARGLASLAGLALMASVAFLLHRDAPAAPAIVAVGVAGLAGLAALALAFTLDDGTRRLPRRCGGLALLVLARS